MDILAVDTSTEYCSVALWRDGQVDSAGTQAGQRHSEMLLPMVDDLLKRHGIAVAGLDGLAYARGPGSFTGLRIACGVAQGLAFGAGLKVVGIDTLAAMAQGSGAEGAVCCLDARMDEIYHAAYRRVDGAWREVHAPRLCAPADAPPLPEGAWTGCGNGFAVHEATLGRRFAGRLSVVLPGLFPHARDVAVLAAEQFASGLGMPAEQALPLYLRDKVALKSAER